MNNKKQPAKDESAQNSCTDKNCPVHGSLKVRGRAFTGVVISDRMSKTVVVSWTRRVYVPKYERYEKRKSKINAHNPDCMDAEKGNVVKIMETRPLSKTKNFVVVEVIGTESKKKSLRDEEVAAAELARNKVLKSKQAEKPKAESFEDSQ